MVPIASCRWIYIFWMHSFYSFFQRLTTFYDYEAPFNKNYRPVSLLTWIYSVNKCVSVCISTANRWMIWKTFTKALRQFHRFLDVFRFIYFLLFLIFLYFSLFIHFILLHVVFLWLWIVEYVCSTLSLLLILSISNHLTSNVSYFD